MNRKWLGSIIGLGALLQVGCSASEPNTFTFKADLPPGFAYWARMNYEPDPGTECVVTDWRRSMPEINRNWQENYSPSVEIEVRKVLKGCQMVLSQIEMKIFARYGKKPMDFSYHHASVGVYFEQDEKYRRAFSADGESVFYGECQWMFRTMSVGKNRLLAKYIECRKDMTRGEKSQGLVSAGYLVDDLPGKVVVMSVRLDDEDAPAIDDTWVKVSGGWKRCMGIGPDDPDGFCRGNETEFREFTGLEREVCTIYPGCKE